VFACILEAAVHIKKDEDQLR